MTSSNNLSPVLIILTIFIIIIVASIFMFMNEYLVFFVLIAICFSLLMRGHIVNLTILTIILLFIVSLYLIVTECSNTVVTPYGDNNNNIQLLGSWIVMIIIAILVAFSFSDNVLNTEEDDNPNNDTPQPSTARIAGFVGLFLLLIISLLTMNVYFIISAFAYVLITTLLSSL